MHKYGVFIGNMVLGFVLFFLIVIAANVTIYNLLPMVKSFAILSAPISFVLVTLIMGKVNKKQPWTYGWQDQDLAKRFFTGAVIAILIVVLGSVAILMTKTVQISTNNWGLSSMVVQIAVLLLVAIGEEMFFRDFLYNVSKGVANIFGVIVINGVVFSGIHLINAGAIEQPVLYIVVGMINIFLITAIFMQSRIYTNSLWMPIGLHFLFNVTQSCFFGFVNGGKAAESVFKLVYVQPSILNGGLFGMEASLLFTPVLMITIFIFWMIERKDRTISE